MIEADAGVEWDDLVEWAVQHELWGLENLALIPGKVSRTRPEHRSLTVAKRQGCDPNRCSAQRPSTRSCPEQRTMRVRVPGQRLQTCPRVIITSGPLCVEPHAPTPPRIRGPGRRGRSAGRHHAAQHPRGRLDLRSAGPSCPTLRVTGNAGKNLFKNPVVGREEPNACSALYPRYAALSGSRPFASQAGRRLADRPRRTERPQRRTRGDPPPAGAGDYQPRRRYGYGDRRFRPQKCRNR